MAHFRDDEAREIILGAYGRVRSDGASVATAFYRPEELEALLNAHDDAGDFLTSEETHQVVFERNEELR